MKPFLLEAWLAQVERSCEILGTRCLDLIIDQSGSETSLLTSVRSVEPPLPWYSLFTGLPEEGAIHLAPLLVRVDLTLPLQRHWLGGLVGELGGNAQLLFLASRWDFGVLAEHLGQAVEARCGKSTGILRFYDPRVFPVLFSHVLEPEQQQRWLRPALFWSWLDRDGVGQFLPGTFDEHSGADDYPLLAFSERQIGVMSCIAEAKGVMADPDTVLPADWGAEQRFQACFEALQEASRAGLVEARERSACCSRLGTA